MDVITWLVALAVGLLQPSLLIAIAAGWAASIALRAYQYFLPEPRAWGEFPADFLGGLFMLAVTAAFAWLGHYLYSRRNRAEA